MNKVSQDTDDYLAGKMSKFQSRFGPQAYTAHIADIDAEIARINRMQQTLTVQFATGKTR